MKRWLQKHFKRYMIRPVIYQSFTRLVMGLTAALLWNFLTNTLSVIQLHIAWAFIAVGAFYTVMCWMAYLRLDGLKTPVFDRKLFLRKSKPVISSYGDMSDYVDQEPISFEELEPEEKDACLLVSNALCALIFMVTSALL